MEDQFGFRRGRGTREAILALRVMNRFLDLTFIDVEKVFDTVNWEQLFKVMKNVGTDWRDISLIVFIQEPKIDIDGTECKAKIRKGVRQWCPLSAYLFNVFIEGSIAAMKENTKGIQINGNLIHCIRFAYCIVVLANSEKDMNRMLKILAEELQHGI